ncbi:uncharacterized protein LOC110850929 isoform X2 [Folsomia candida]|uniref:uncharacterized protein LOC110850929 isoform X2 n=1 Tax=Folsomia candida TaxID=158441 RepID=UPI00160504A5|nr:uncharacterized protein LOC110850929 isoform X2 [Folsomia candida]
MAFESEDKMEKSVLAILLLCLPGLLSASCSNPQPPQYLVDPQFFNPDAAFPSSPHDSFDSSNNNLNPDIDSKGDECKNGWCGEDGNCICNPCWSGPTCQEYVDRFAPRFLAEEPFFIVEASSPASNGGSNSGGSGYSTFLDPAFDPVYPQFAYSSSSSSSADFVDPAPSPSLPPTNSWTKGGSTTAATTSTQHYQPQFYPQFHSHQNPLPLFRIESADDDLGLTCQLGQIGPAATCPCATPRYKVVGATTTFPEKSLDHPPSFEDGLADEDAAGAKGSGGGGKGDDSSPLTTSKECRNQSHNHPGNNLFWADEETGDVFLRQGFKLQPSKHYFITLQVSALPVNSSGYKPWKDEVVATLFVRPPSSMEDGLLDGINNMLLEPTLFSATTTTPATPSSETETQHSSSSRHQAGGGGLGQLMVQNELKSEDASPFSSGYLFSKSSTEVYSESNSKEGNEQVLFQEEDNKEISLLGQRDSSKSKQTLRRINIRNSKTKLPYALRGDRPHYKFGDYQKKHHKGNKDGGRSRDDDPDSDKDDVNMAGQKDQPPSNDDDDDDDDDDESAEEVVRRSPQPAMPPAFFGEETFLHRWKRQTLLTVPEDFQLTLSRVSDTFTSGKMGLGDKIKMQLVIQVPSSVNSVDFDVEILSTKEVPRFAILSAHVSSIGSDISFDKDHTNLAPILKPSKNVSLYDSALWHWKGVSREGKNEHQSNNKGITIDFDIVPVGGASYSNVSRRAPLLQLSSLPTSSSLSKGGSRSSSRYQGHNQRTNVSPLGKMTKDFNTYLLPIRAHLTFPPPPPPKNGEAPHQQPYQSNTAEKISQQRLFTLFVNSSASADTLPNGSASGHWADKNLNMVTTTGNRLLNRVHGVRVGVEGPREIPQGEWKSYTVKVYLHQPTQFKLTIEQVEGNEIADQDSISVGDIRLVKMGKNIASCNQLSEKVGFRVFCKKLSGGRKGDLCTIESPSLNLCPLNLHHRSDRNFSNEEDDELLAPASSKEDDNDNSAKEDDSEENALVFQGIIYGLPGAAPGSQFVLRAKVQAQLNPSPTMPATVYQEEKTLSGKIVQRRIESKAKGSKTAASKEKNDFHTGKNRISIMPHENENGGGHTATGEKFIGNKRMKDPTTATSRSRRSIFNSQFLTSSSAAATTSSQKKPKRQSATGSVKSHHRRLQNLRRFDGKQV